MQRLYYSEVGQVTVLDALAVVLQHPAVAADQQNICSLLQVSKSWRQTVKQSAACLTDVTVKAVMYPDEVRARGPTGFCSWLPAHAGLVRSIELDETCAPGRYFSVTPKLKKVKETAMQILERKLVRALIASTLTHGQALDVVAVASSRAATAAAAAGSAKPQLLQLQSFTYERCANAELLSALPAASLTSLQTLVHTKPCMATFEALQCLTNLRSLSLAVPKRYWSQTKGLPTACISSIQHLSRLTDLRLDFLSDSSAVKMLPQQLCQLELGYRSSDPLDLSHLTRLQHLVFFTSSEHCVAAGSGLPEQLQTLELSNRHDKMLTRLGVAALSNLRRLKAYADITAEELQLLAVLPRLQQVSVVYHEPDVAVRASRVWSQVPVTDLEMVLMGRPDDAIEVFQSFSGLYGLTRLVITCDLFGIDVLEDECIELVNGVRCVQLRLFESFKYLKTLQALTLYFRLELDEELSEDVDDIPVTVEPYDVLHLSNLTQLTTLNLECDWEMHSSVPVAVLMQLTKLQDFSIYYPDCCGLVHAMPLIGALTDLTRLHLPGVPAEQQQGSLQYLSRLRKLKELSGFEECSQEVMQQFWATLRA